MKTVYIIRHAKSDQRFFGNDFERPLNDRGKTDAPMMAKRLAEKKLLIDGLIASPAVRAKETAGYFAKVLNIKKDDILLVSALYHAAPEVFYDVISGLPENLNSVALFSHNPGITYFVNSLTNRERVDNMPTCAIFAVSADIDDWSLFFKAEKKFLFFDYPKK